MSVLNKLASALNRRDEVSNQELAAEILRTKDKRAVTELVENLANKNKKIQNDCIKTLYEIGEREPSLIAHYYREFGKLLDSKNSRLIWGGMMALDAIASSEPKAVYGLLSRILEAADGESVIARDRAVGILVKLGSLKQYAATCVPLLLEQLQSCPNNQFPMYVEMSLALANDANKGALQKIMTRRLESLERDSQKKRVTRVLRQLEKKS